MAPELSKKIVVLGGGVAAGYLARDLAEGQGGTCPDLLIVSREQYLPYERPALSKGYLQPEGAPRPPNFNTSVGSGGTLQDAEWYKRAGIQVLTSTVVEKADLKGKTLTTSKGQTIRFETLIIATGQRPLTFSDIYLPGSQLKGVHYLRDIADADQLLKQLSRLSEVRDQPRGWLSCLPFLAKKRRVRSVGRVVVVGGSYIGQEVAAMVSRYGVDVTLVVSQKHVMSRLFTEEIAGFYESKFQANGVTLAKKARVVGLLGDTNVEACKLSDGQILPADLVVVGIGSRPNTELFQGQLDFAGKGIKVDGQFRTSVDGVYAIGDVAAFPMHFEEGKVVQQEHVAHARASAAHVANVILNPDTEDYNYVPYFYSRIFDASWVFYGASWGALQQFGDRHVGKFGAAWVRDGVLRGIFLEGADDEVKAMAKKYVHEGRAVDDVLIATIGME